MNTVARLSNKDGSAIGLSEDSLSSDVILSEADRSEDSRVGQGRSFGRRASLRCRRIDAHLAGKPDLGENSGPTRKEKRRAMFADQIEQMKSQYTDKYVVVDGKQPELARFRDLVGRVKTVNMNGRALVEFDDYLLNVGWFDIAPEYLKVVDKPPPKAPKVEAKKAAPKAAPAAKKPAAASPPTGGAAAKGGKPSVADILAAARGGKAGAAPAPKAPSASAPAGAKPAAAPKVDRSKMSVADMLAAARSGGAAGAKPAAAPVAKATVPKGEPTA